ncbi:PQQ-dependent sugar dehydrogenase [Bacterioplanoides sp.]|uniref:PQQ-dependent sugar dehydrogenase n=1 Tax=Bacterioplanoides sp. TaxID=2066072 RepID=UPI003B5CFA9C
MLSVISRFLLLTRCVNPAFFVRLTVLAMLTLFALNSQAGYPVLKQQCDGLPQVAVGTEAGFCLGLIIDNKDLPFKKPRKAIPVAGTHQLLVTDMGGWGPSRGVLWLLEFADERYSKLINAHRLAEKLMLPHDIKHHSDGWFYIGEADKLWRFRLSGSEISEKEIVIKQLPYDRKTYRHPLTSFVFMADNSLLINVGSASDDCGLTAGDLSQGRCEEASWVGLRRYPYVAAQKNWSQQYQQYATGLRNSVALVTHDSGTVLQAENSSDIKDAEEPFEEINQVIAGGFYGWPYCLNREFDQQFIADGCHQKNYQPPYSLMPPHTAPLDMMYYPGKKLPGLQGKLLISWHGYRVIGNRLVAYAVDQKGLPVLQNAQENPIWFKRDPIAPATEFTTHIANPKGGSAADAQHQEVISQWNKVADVRPEGAPVGLAMLPDESLLIVDDKNKALLRLSTGSRYIDPAQELSASPTLTGLSDEYLFRDDAKDLLLKECSACHQELTSQPGALLNRRDGWLRREGNKTLLQLRLTGEAGQMPPTGSLTNTQIKTLLNAIVD